MNLQNTLIAGLIVTAVLAPSTLAWAQTTDGSQNPTPPSWAAQAGITDEQLASMQNMMQRRQAFMQQRMTEEQQLLNQLSSMNPQQRWDAFRQFRMDQRNKARAFREEQKQLRRTFRQQHPRPWAQGMNPAANQPQGFNF